MVTGYTDTRKQMEAGDLTDCVDFSYWLGYIYFKEDGGLFQPIKEHFIS